MATNIGAVEYIARIDGKRLPKDARDAGDRAGKSFGDGFDKQFSALQAKMSKSFSKFGNELAGSMRESGELSGHVFTDALKGVISSDLEEVASRLANAFGRQTGLDETIAQYGDAEKASRALREDMNQLHESGGLTDDMWKRLGGTLSQWLGKQREATAALEADNESMRRQTPLRERMAASFAVLTDRLQKINIQSNSFFSRWKTMPRGFRQAVLYTALFAALGESIAVLGAASGVALTVAGGAALGAAAGLGVAIAAFRGFTGELSELPAAVQPAAAAFQSLGGMLDRLQDSIQVNALQNTTGAWVALGGLIQTLTPAFNVLAVSVGNVINQLAGMLTSANGISVLQSLLGAAGQQFELLMSAVFNLGGALGNIFVQAQPTITVFLTWLNQIMTDFNLWTQSLAGQDALAEWFSNGSTVLASLGPLLAATAQALSSLVTPETAGQLAGFFDTITEFMPILGQLLGVIGSLNVFGVLAVLLNAVGTVLQPLIPLLDQFAVIIADALVAAIVAITPMLTQFAGFLADNPALIVAAVAALALLKGALAGIAIVGQVVSAFQLLKPILSAVAGLLGPLLAPILGALATAFRVLWTAVTGPVGIVIAAITAVVAALVWFFTQTELGKEIWANFTQFLSEAWTNIVSFVAQAIMTVQATITSVVSAIVAYWTSAWDRLVGIVTTVFNAIVDFLSPIMNAIFVIIDALLQIIGAAWALAWWAISTVFTTVWNAIVSFLTPIIATIQSVISTTLSVISSVWNSVWGAISGFFMGIWNGIVGFISPIIQQIANVIAIVVNGISSTWNSVWGAISSFFSGIWNGIVGAVGGYIRGVQNTISSVMNAIKSAWDSVWGGFASVVGGIWSGIQSTIKNGVNGIIGIINGMLSSINSVGGALSSLTGGAVNLNVGKIPKLANGYLASRSMFANIGEDGPEAVVPLNRPLSQVHPSVRDLSAYAQGKGGAAVAPGKNVTFEAGSIVVQSRASDTRIVATQVVDLIAANV